MAVSTIILGLAVGLMVYAATVLLTRYQRQPQLPLPPGPKGLPLLGNIADMPKPGVMEAEHWLQLKEKYGPIASLNLMGMPVIVLNDAQMTFDLLDKRSAKFSSRPPQVFCGQLVGWDKSLGLSGYNQRFKTHRQNMSRLIGSKSAASQFHGLQHEQIAHFLLHLVDKPEELVEHTNKAAGSIILKIAYGYNTESFKEDAFTHMALDAMDKFGRASFGAFLVDIIPIMRYIPAWFPGAGWKRTANQWAAELHDVVERPHAFVKYQMAQGTETSSFLSRLIEVDDTEGERRLTNKWSAASLFTAGADTTVASILWFFLSMSVYPEVERKAQEELDRVVGQDRLPTYSDRDNLPYIDAVLKEILRWQPVAPMAIPHFATEDDVYMGYSIPKGTMLMPNSWHFMHDPAVYKDPSVFNPERHLGPTPEPDPRIYAFGFGRRVCPGRNLAENSLYLAVVQTLATFHISKAVDDNGNVIEPTIKMLPGIVSHPAPFKVAVKPRSEHHERLVRSLEETYPWVKSDADAIKEMGV